MSIIIEPILAFDLGGHHVTAAVIGPDGLPLLSVTTPLQAPCSMGLLLSEIEKTGRKATELFDKRKGPPVGLSIAVPGPFDYERGISLMTHKYPEIYGLDLREHLAGYFSVKPKQVLFLNDAEAFLIGEAVCAGLSSNRVVGLTLGTGIGSAFLENGVVIREDHRVPTEGAIWNLPWLNGSVEDVLSTRAICDAYQRATGASLTVKEISHLASTNATAKNVLVAFGRDLGLIADSVCANFQPEYIILGGGIARSAPLYLDAMADGLSVINPSIVVSTLFENAALYGAAHFWWQQTH